MKNNYRIVDETVYIECNHKGGTVEVLIDLDDLPRLENEINNTLVVSSGSGHRNTLYCRFKHNGKQVLLHRFLLNYDGKDPIDHISTNGLDNRRENLRILSKCENAINLSKPLRNNKSGTTGVYFNKQMGKWRAYINVQGVNTHLGYFDNFDDAVQARKDAEQKYYPNIKEEIA